MSIDAMKQVLAVMDTVAPSVEASAPRYYAAREALRAAIEQAEKPWVKTYAGGKPNYTVPEERQELVCVCGAIWEGQELVSTPPQRTWVGLTAEELDQAMDYWSDPSRSAYGGADRANGEYVDMKDTWRYIEAKLKEKNT